MGRGPRGRAPPAVRLGRGGAGARGPGGRSTRVPRVSKSPARPACRRGAFLFRTTAAEGGLPRGALWGRCPAPLAGGSAGFRLGRGPGSGLPRPPAGFGRNPGRGRCSIGARRWSLPWGRALGITPGAGMRCHFCHQPAFPCGCWEPCTRPPAASHLQPPRFRWLPGGGEPLGRTQPAGCEMIHGLGWSALVGPRELLPTCNPSEPCYTPCLPRPLGRGFPSGFSVRTAAAFSLLHRHSYFLGLLIFARMDYFGELSL